MKKKFLLAILILTLAVGLAACGGVEAETPSDQITASGNIAAPDVNISPEISGKVTEIYVNEGDQVNAGDMLFEIDDELIQAQYDQAQAAVGVAEAAVNAAEAQLSSAQIQYEIALQSVRAQDQQSRSQTWLTPQPDEIDLPSWYFVKQEKIDSTETEIETAKEELEIAQADLEDLLNDVSNDDFISTEVSLAEAQTAFNNAAYTLQQAEQAQDNDSLVDVAQASYDSALAALEAVQLDYDRLLTTTAAEDVLEARAKVAVAQVRYDNAQDTLLSYQTGDDALQLQAAEASVTQAESALAQAEAGLEQAKASIKPLEIQIEKATVTAPVSGVVLAQNLEVGELTAAGTISMKIGKLEEVTLTVYIPEDSYGRISLGQEAIVTVDSFPNKTFSGTVTYIANEAEFTPRNVQTAEERTTTVYAIKITLENRDLDLKPGMPADVTIYTD